VPMDQNATEILLALGLEHVVAGYARVHFDPTEPVLPDFADAYEDLDLIAETNPSREVFLAAEPDLAVAAFGFSGDSGLSEEGLRADGIETFLLRDQCQDRDGPVELDDLHATIADLGALFGVPERAEALVADLRATVADVRGQVADEEPVRVFVYDSGADAPFTVGNGGMSDAVITAAGGQNIFSDTDDQFFTSSWEEVLGRDPEVVVIMDYLHGDDGDDASAKRRIVEDRLATTAAGRDGRVETMQLTGFLLGVRNAETVAALADVLHR
jgi:iron complex transport system substrate-binding protein